MRCFYRIEKFEKYSICKDYFSHLGTWERVFLINRAETLLLVGERTISSKCKVYFVIKRTFNVAMQLNTVAC